MLGIWLSVAQVVISGYQPIAEQTWVQLNPEYYPLHRAPPAMFVAWHGNQYPPLATKQKQGRWQVLFPARLVPPFDLFEGEAQLSKAYLARLRRIDELAYGVAPAQAVANEQPVSRSPRERDDVRVPFIAEFSAPRTIMMAGQWSPHAADEREPLLANLGVTVSEAGIELESRLMVASATSPDKPDLALPAPASGERHAVCHQVAAGETLWRIASQLSSARGMDTYSYLLALAAENKAHLGDGIRVKTGDGLYCPSAETLAKFDALSQVQRQQQFARLERGH